MRTDIIIGLLVAIFWGLFGIIIKAISKEINLSILNLLVGLGIFVTALLFSLYDGLLKISFGELNTNSLILAFLAGVSWFIATYFFNKGILSGSNISILIIVAGLNVVFVALAGLLIFKEKIELWRILTASLLYIIILYLLS